MEQKTKDKEKSARKEEGKRMQKYYQTFFLHTDTNT